MFCCGSSAKKSDRKQNNVIENSYRDSDIDKDSDSDLGNSCNAPLLPVIQEANERVSDAVTVQPGCRSLSTTSESSSAWLKSAEDQMNQYSQNLDKGMILRAQKKKERSKARKSKRKQSEELAVTKQVLRLREDPKLLAGWKEEEKVWGVLQSLESDRINDRFLVLYINDFYDDVSMLCGVVQHHCTDEKCPKMAAEGSSYLWSGADGTIGGKCKPKEISASQYTENVIRLVRAKLDGFAFQKVVDAPIPKASAARAKSKKSKVRKDCQLCFKFMIRLYAHMYHRHLKTVVRLGVENHLNTCFCRFVFFGVKFELLQSSELTPLGWLVEALSGTSTQRRRDQLSLASTCSTNSIIHSSTSSQITMASFDSTSTKNFNSSTEYSSDLSQHLLS